METTSTTTPIDDTAIDDTATEAQVGEFADRVFSAALGSLELFTIFVGDELGLYAALHAMGAATPAALAGECGIDERYAREWLEQQAAAGILAVVGDSTNGDPAQRVFALPAAQAEVLVNRDSLAFLAPMGRFLAGTGKVADRIVDAYRTGGGLSFGAYGDEIRTAQAELNRVQFRNLLTTEWLPAMPDVVERLSGASSALVADVGCGAGWSTIAIATAFPNVRVHGFDLDEASIDDARRNAEDEGVADRVTFELRDAADAAPGAYDLVCMFEALHDTGRPADVLAALRTMAGPGGTVFLVDERVADEFTPDADPTERFMYAASAVHCLLVGRSDPHNHATGTVLRRSVLRGLVEQAGFRGVDELPIEHDMWRFYRLAA
jgi:2-polyprenyl-3-methyl-5-hydroxy-6-metoxy-1,4-benzoquinol methylase